MTTPLPTTASTFPCAQCGAELAYTPGTTNLTCSHCGAANEIPVLEHAVEEQDFEAMLADVADRVETEDRITVHCDSCGADVPMAPNRTSQSCPFCSSNIVATAKSQKVIRPMAVLPFAIDRTKAREMFRSWISSLWFAPSKLKTYARIDDAAGTKGTGLAGIYLPYWTYDARATTPYTGQRGDYYTVPVPYTRVVNGKTVSGIRQERRIRWTWVSGTVNNAFDDVLVPAATSVAHDKLERLGGWDLEKLVPYSDSYLAGFGAESYTIDLLSGWGQAQQEMVERIKVTVCGDIGGDQQRIQDMDPRYSGITFKHILLPVWIAAYRFRERTFRFIINARTGQVSGERPYSAWKIAFLVLVIPIVIGVIVLLASK